MENAEIHRSKLFYLSLKIGWHDAKCIIYVAATKGHDDLTGGEAILPQHKSESGAGCNVLDFKGPNNTRLRYSKFAGWRDYQSRRKQQAMIDMLKELVEAEAGVPAQV